MFIRLGRHRLEAINSPQLWNITNEKNIAEVPIIGSKPIVQDIGEKLDVMSISVSLNSEFCNPKKVLDELLKSQFGFEILDLVTGSGVYYGKYVISKIDRSNSRCTDIGDVKSISVDIELKEYSGIVTEENEGVAIISNNPAAETPIQQKPLLPTEINRGLLDSKLRFKEVDTNNLTSNKFKKIKELSIQSRDILLSTNKKIEDSKKLIFKAKKTYDAITTTISALNDMISAASMNNVSQLLNANIIVKDSFDRIDKASVELLPFIGGRYDY